MTNYSSSVTNSEDAAFLLKSNPSNGEESTTPQKEAVNARTLTVRVSNVTSRVCLHGKEYGGTKLASHYDAPIGPVGRHFRVQMDRLGTSDDVANSEEDADGCSSVDEVVSCVSIWIVMMSTLVHRIVVLAHHISMFFVKNMMFFAMSMKNNM